MSFYLACAYEMMGVTSSDQWIGSDGNVTIGQYREYARTLLDTMEPSIQYEGMRRDVYDLLDGFNASDYFASIPMNEEKMTFPTADTPGFTEAYAALSVYGTDSIPYMMEYLITAHSDVYYTNDWELFDRYAIITVAYHMLGVTGDPTTDWINPPPSEPHPMTGANFLLEFLNRYGADGIRRRAEVYEALDGLWLTQKEINTYFPTPLPTPVSKHFPGKYQALLALGEDAIPFILLYIQEDEYYPGKPYDKTESYSKDLFLLAVTEMLGIEATATYPPSPLELLDRLADDGMEAFRPANP
jgi:hypothetical protein